MTDGIEYARSIGALSDKMREMGVWIAVRTPDGSFCAINSTNHRMAPALAKAIRMVIDDQAQIVPLDLPAIYRPQEPSDAR